MSKKQFLISIIAIVVISVGSSVLMIVLEWNDSISSSILWGLIILLIGYTYLRYRISAPLQRFSSKFNMLVDYDLDIELAKNMAFQGMQEAPFNNIKQYYQMYYSMALYYSGEYSEAIKYFHLLDLKKLNPIYQVLIFSITAYCAYEIDDQEEFDQSLDRVKALETHITGRYHGYAASYVDILDSIKNIDTDPETYRVMVEKHFGKQDGYITTQLNYKYRMAIYYQKVGNIEEMD